MLDGESFPSTIEAVLLLFTIGKRLFNSPMLLTEKLSPGEKVEFGVRCPGSLALEKIDSYY
jgi:hypothetical protein